MYRDKGHGTNQATMEIGMPSDIKLDDPPCLRIIDTRIRYGNCILSCTSAPGTSGRLSVKPRRPAAGEELHGG